MKKALALGMAAAMSCTLLAGCGGSAASSTASSTASAPASTAAAESAGYELSSDPVTLTMCWWGGDSRAAAYQAAVDAFCAKNPNITVNVDFGAWTGWEDKMSTYFAAGTASDVCQVNWNWLSSYSGQGQTFMDLNTLSDYIDLSQFNDGALAQCTVAGALQCIPVAMTGRIFYWNTATFEKAGISTPTTLDELMAAGKTFQEKLGDDYYPLALGEYDRMILMVYYLESMYGTDWVVDGQLQYTQEQIEEGLTFIQSLEDGHVTPSIQTIAGDGAESLDKNPKWMDGRYAGIFEWDSSAKKFAGALEDASTFVVGDEIKYGSNNGGYTKVSLGLAITKTCEHPAEAASLINFILNDAEGAAIMGSECGIPLSTAGKAAAADALDATTVEANGKVLDFCSNALDPTFESSALKASDGVYYDVMAGLSYGDYDVATAAETLIDGINGVLG